MSSCTYLTLFAAQRLSIGKATYILEYCRPFSKKLFTFLGDIKLAVVEACYLYLVSVDNILPIRVEEPTFIINTREIPHLPRPSHHHGCPLRTHLLHRRSGPR